MYVDRKEALRYMGYKGQHMDDNMERLLEACADEVMAVSKKSCVYEVFDIERTGEVLSVKGTTLTLSGNNIRSHLSKAEKCAVMAATLGVEIDRRIALYSRTDLTKGLIFDACAAAAIESLCDEVQGEIQAEARTMGLEITSRFSPGYGDFSIDIQKDIMRVLRTYERIGLSVNENCIMIPRKSVTAFIGFQKEGCIEENHKCEKCKDIYCMFRKDVDKNE